MVVQDDKSVKFFFSLLRSGMYGTPVPEVELPATIDWQPVVALARKHAVYGIIIDSVQYLPECLRPSGALSASMSKFALDLIRSNLILDKTAARLVTFLAGHGITGVLLKGQGVARYYRQPQMRQCGDIDFYVGEQQYNKAMHICNEQFSDDIDPSDESEKHFVFHIDGVTIEIHRLAANLYSPYRKKRFRKWLVSELEASTARRTLTLDNTPITLPSYDFDAIFIFYHAWRHFIMGGIGLRQLCDWAMIFHSHGADIDQQRLAANLNSFGLTKAWQFFAYIAVHYLGVAPEKMPLYNPAVGKVSEKMLSEILLGGNFGFYFNTFTRSHRTSGRTGFWHSLGTVRVLAGYSASLFPYMPVEAVSLFFNYFAFGLKKYSKKILRKRSI